MGAQLDVQSHPMPGLAALPRQTAFDALRHKLTKLITSREFLHGICRRHAYTGVISDSHLQERFPMTQLLRKLPTQPIPSLADTLGACVSSVSPMLNGLQRLKSKLVFEIYGATQAKKQQERLLALARQQPVNWCAAGLTRFWLSCRGGLPFTNNYAMLLEDDPHAESLTERAARLIVAALQLYQSVRMDVLPTDMADDRPLEMGQYSRCFATHRVPRAHCDEVVTITGSQHIAVLVGGSLHYLVVDPQRAVWSLPAIRQALKEMVAQEAKRSDHEAGAPGMFTALPRDDWARLRDGMLEDPHNKQALMLLEKALFVVCLDAHIAPVGLTGLSTNLRDGNFHNRFYDKSMQIIVTENGKAGLCFERSAVDGSVALGFAARLQRESLRLPAMEQASPPSQGQLRHRAVDWSLSRALKRRLRAAERTVTEMREQRDIEVWKVRQLGLNVFKGLNVSPDAAVQLALQLACDEVTGQIPHIFEPVQIRHFAGGRLDFIMPVTAESLSAVRSMQDGDGNQFITVGQIRRAAKAHQALVVNTKNGRGLVSHLLALNAVQPAESSGMRSWRHKVLSHLDKGLQVLLRQEVLASNASGYAGIASFGPIGPRPNMLSIGYLIKDNEIVFDLRADGRYCAHIHDLRAALERSLLRIKGLLTTSQKGQVR
jgi:carnitine O-acetyltransferase